MFSLSVNDSGAAAEQQAEITVTILLFCPLIRTGHSIYRYDVIHVANGTRSICSQSLFSGLMGVSRQGVFLSPRGGELFKDNWTCNRQRNAWLVHGSCCCQLYRTPELVKHLYFCLSTDTFFLLSLAVSVGMIVCIKSAISDLYIPCMKKNNHGSRMQFFFNQSEMLSACLLYYVFGLLMSDWSTLDLWFKLKQNSWNGSNNSFVVSTVA